MAEHLTEEQQVEAIKSWWKDNGMAVVLGLLIGFGGLFGWNYYQDQRDERAAQASLVYQQLLTGLQANKTDVVSAKAQALIDNYASTPYAVMAAFALAKQAVDAGDMPMAKTHLQWILDNTRQEQFQHTARLRLARVMLSANELDAAEKLVSTVEADAYAPLYAELQGDIALARGDSNAARAAYKSALEGIENDPGLTTAIQQKLDDVAVAAEAG